MRPSQKLNYPRREMNRPAGTYIFELTYINYSFNILLPKQIYHCTISGLQRLPAQRFRKPLNRRIGTTVNSGFKVGRFNSKPINKISKPKPNLARFPGEL